MLELIAEDAPVAPKHSSEIRSLMSAIRVYQRKHVVRRYLTMMPNEIDARQMHRLFALCESEGSEKSIHRIFRSFVYKYASCIHFDGEVSRKSICFKSKNRRRDCSRRALISDLSDLSEVISDVPIGALHVSSIADARRKLRMRAQNDLNKIRAACIQDLEYCALVRKKAQRLAEVHAGEKTIALVWRAMRNKQNARDIVTSACLAPEALLPLVLMNFARHPEVISKFDGSYVVPMSDQLHEILFGTNSPYKSVGSLEIVHRALTEELFSALHLLQTYTGWNFSSVLQIQSREIRHFDGKMVEIQSFKDKTDDDTPVVVLDLQEPGVKQALDLLMWNFDRVRQLDIISPKDDFLGKVKSSRGAGVDFLQPKWPLAAFLERHGFSKYTLDQVRTQFLFIKSLEGGAIEAARLTGGHVSTDTTEGYISNIIQERI